MLEIKDEGKRPRYFDTACIGCCIVFAVLLIGFVAWFLWGLQWADF
jgi:hypothetical protein